MYKFYKLPNTVHETAELLAKMGFSKRKGLTDCKDKGTWSA